MTKFSDRIKKALGNEIAISDLAAQSEINSISYRYGKEVQTKILLDCDFPFVEFQCLPLDFKRCFCGQKIEICFVLNHISTGKQFVLGKDCLFSIFGDRLKKKCKNCGVVSTKDNRVRSNGVCKLCLLANSKILEPSLEKKRNSFEFIFRGSSELSYIEYRARVIMPFGKYRGLLCPAQIKLTDPGYFRWLVSTVENFSCLKDL